MFQFTGFPPYDYGFIIRWLAVPAGFPHSDIHGSLPVCGSPWLFAAYHVFHRLSVPRHPPCALSCLTFVVPHSHAAWFSRCIPLMAIHKVPAFATGSARSPAALVSSEIRRCSYASLLLAIVTIFLVIDLSDDNLTSLS